MANGAPIMRILKMETRWQNDVNQGMKGPMLKETAFNNVWETNTGS
jgi:hypothetical protein